MAEELETTVEEPTPAKTEVVEEVKPSITTEEPETEEVVETTPDDAELDDETLETISDAYLDRLLETKTFGKAYEERLNQEIERRSQDYEREQRASGESEAVLNRGKVALANLRNAFSAAKEQIDKAVEAELEDLDPSVVDQGSLLSNLREYGDAIELQVTGSFDRAIGKAFTDLLRTDLPQLTEDHANELAGILTKANSLSADPQKSRDFFFGNVLKFIAARSREYGAIDALRRLDSKKTLKDKIASQNAVAAAKAKIERTKNPPKPTSAVPAKSNLDGISLEDYRAAKKEKNFERAQEIADEWRRMRQTGVLSP